MTYRVEAYYLAAHNDAPKILTSQENIDALVDELLGLTEHNSAATLYNLDRPSQETGFPDHEFSLAVDRDLRVGGLKFTDATGNWVSRGSETDQPKVRRYYRVGDEIEFGPGSCIPLELVRQAGKEFLTSKGQRPTCVHWQEDDHV